MSWPALSGSQMVSYTDAQGGGFTLQSGQSAVTSNQCMDKTAALAKYVLNSVSMSAYASNQLVPKSSWFSAAASHTVYWSNQVVGVGLYDNLIIQVNGVTVVDNTTYGTGTASGSFSVADGDALYFTTEGLTSDIQYQQLTLTEGTNYLTYMNTTSDYPYQSDSATVLSSYSSSLILTSTLSYA